MSVLDAVRERFRSEMLRGATGQDADEDTLKVLVVDDRSLKVLSSAMRMYDIIEEDVTLVEKIDISRQPLPSMDAIYFLTPTANVVDLMLADFPSSKNRLYHAAYVFFTGPLSDELFALIRESKMVKRIKALKELHLDFLAVEPRVFTLGMDNGLQAFFSVRASLRRAVDKVSDRLASVCFTLNERPGIRYQRASDDNATQAMRLIAEATAAKLDRLYAGGGSPTTGGTLLVVDRSYDVLAPLVHEFTYQAMCYDMLDIEGNHYRIPYEKNTGERAMRDVLLDESDRLWVELRHLHIAEASDSIVSQFNDFVANNATAQVRRHGHNTKLADVGAAIRGMPEYQEALREYTTHMEMTQQVTSTFNETHLMEVGTAEQNLTLGEDENGKAVKNILGEVTTLLADPAVTPEARLRLLMTYIITEEGIREEDRDALMSTADLDFDHQNTVANLAMLGVQLSRGKKQRWRGKKKKKKNKRRAADDDVPYILSRFVPNLQFAMEDIVEGRLDEDAFPFVPGTASSSTAATRGSSRADAGRSQRTFGLNSRWAKKRKDTVEENVSATQPHVIVFVAGGMTHSEMRAAYKVAGDRDANVIIGSTHITTPNQFVDDLSRLNDSRSRSGSGSGGGGRGTSSRRRRTSRRKKGKSRRRHRSYDSSDSASH